MNILTDFEAHKRDEDFDREDAKRHRETCSPAGGCYIRFVENVREGQHYCDRHRPEPKPGDSYVCTGSTCYDAGKPHTHRYAPIPDELIEPKCSSCGDTGEILTWRMTRNGYTDGKEPCRYCQIKSDD